MSSTATDPEAQSNVVHRRGDTPFRARASRILGAMADLRVPRAIRTALFGAWATATGSVLHEVLLPLEAHGSLGAFFVRRLASGARRFPDDPALLASPVDGAIQALDEVGRGWVLQAKGRPYPVRELLAGVGMDVDLEGGLAITLYLAPRDYHRIHTPTDADLVEVKWVDGSRYSVRPSVLAATSGVLAGNERAVLRLETRVGPLFLVLVGALNVGRIRVVGVPYRQAPGTPLRFRQGDELARFEMGSTVIALWPPRTVDPVPALATGRPVRMGDPLVRAKA